MCNVDRRLEVKGIQSSNIVVRVEKKVEKVRR